MRDLMVVSLLLGVLTLNRGLAQEFMGEAEALRQAYPEADAVAPLAVQATAEQIRTVLQRARSTARAQAGQTWVATRGGALVGTAYTDHVIGRTEYITWLCALGADGRVRRLQVLAYREAIGGEIAERRWLDTFTGFGPDDEMRRGRPVSNIAGATMSVDALTERTRYLLDWHAVVVAPLVAARFPTPPPTAAAAGGATATETTSVAVPVGNSAFTVTLSPAGSGDAQLVTAAATVAAHWNQVLNHWEASSELSALNRAGGGVLSADLGTVLQACRGWHALTTGRFDPTVGPLIEALVTGRAPPEGVVGWDLLQWQPNRVTLPTGGTLDLGAVAKGWILDAACAKVIAGLAPGQSLHMDYGASSQLVAGAASYPLRLAHPGDPARICQELRLAPGSALGVANAAGRTFQSPTGRRSHLINPLTKESAPLQRAAFVVAPTAALADVLDTAFCLMPIPEALACARLAGVEALLWDGETFHATAGWSGRPVP